MTKLEIKGRNRMKDEEIKKKAELNLDDLDDRGFDFDEWSITDAYVNGAIFSAEIVTKELEKENEQLKNDYEMIHNCFLITENEKKDLENQIADIKANCDLAIEGRDIKIKELEKENEELRNNGFTVSAMTEQQLKVAIEKGEQLERENAELKARLNAINLLTPELQKRSKLKKQQLIKAKEHIKTLLDCLKQDTNDPQTNYYVCQYMDKAEQFIKEIGN